MADDASAGHRADPPLQKLCSLSPLYAQWLGQRPEARAWLLRPENQQEFRYQALVDEWRNFSRGRTSMDDASANSLEEELREWRRLQSARIALLAVNGLSSETVVVAEMSRLAEFCIHQSTTWARRHWFDRYGEPWDDQLNRPARLAVMALGKLGGQELNFSSDVDLVFVYEGDGFCRRGGGEITPFASVEVFTKIAETIVQTLSRATPAGFLFRVDVRLRPEGASGPLVRSLSSMEHYYSLAGQTWERLAWIKARSIAGDVDLGAELLESLQDFRYPRHPSPSLLTEIAAVKRRTEREVVGAALERDIKSGLGGIREIEFIAQANQVLHAGRFPFLQTHQTEIALQQLARYEVITAADSEELLACYWFLRRVENRLQMREEQAVHTLPPRGETFDHLARSLDFDGAEAFDHKLASVRARVRQAYTALLTEHDATDETFESWWTFLTSPKIPPVVESALQRWMPGEPRAAAELRLLASGDSGRALTREYVQRFCDLANALDQVMPDLSRPALTLRRLARFAERYGSRSHFFSICAAQPTFLRALALLFDRSGGIHELLCAHPEIFEEIIRPENLRLHKTADALDREFAASPGDEPPFARWFPLYIRAEQVRVLLAELLGFCNRQEAQASLVALADAAWRAVLGREAGLASLIVIGLGKYGARELTAGSDLDVLFLINDDSHARAEVTASPTELAVVEEALRRSLRFFQLPDLHGPAWTIDARLRPHGEVGALITTTTAFKLYHRDSAQLWERQALTRSRVAAGPAEARVQWAALANEVIYQPGLNATQRAQIWKMRLRIQNERDLVEPRERAFKSASGGLVDHEFFAQAWALEFGAGDASWHAQAVEELLARVVRGQMLPEQTAARLRENYSFLKNIEWTLRRDALAPVTVLPTDLKALANWLGFLSGETFWTEHVARMRETRELVESFFVPVRG